MDQVDKKKLSNEQRLKAIEQWKKNQNFHQVLKINAAKVKHTHVSTNQNEKVKHKVFHSDDENDDEGKTEKSFDIHSQFEGSQGEQLLDVSSQFSERFKLDERFEEDDKLINSNGEDGERTKYFQILDSVLGHEAPNKLHDKKKSIKRIQIRFDPEDEHAPNYIKLPNLPEEKPRKKMKKENIDDQIEKVPVSSERYAEVNSDLKSLLSTLSSFSFSEKFNIDKNSEDKTFKEIHITTSTQKGSDTKPAATEFKSKPLRPPPTDTSVRPPRVPHFELKVKTENFFIMEGDPRLNEGIRFFMQPKPLENLREEWQKRREIALEIFKKKRRLSQKGYSNPVKSRTRYSHSDGNKFKKRNK